MSDEIRIYVACLAAYNNGILHGEWIDATSDLDDIWDAINAMLKASPVEDAEEYAIHDYEGFDSYRVGEYEGVEGVHKVACFIDRYPEFGGELLNHCSNLDEVETMAEDQYCGCYSSVADYAQQLTEETTEIPKQLQFYIDYERMGRDIEMSGDIFTIETAHDEVHIFWNC